MTQSSERIDVPLAGLDGPEHLSRPAAGQSPAPAYARQWWRSGLLPAALLSLAFFLYALPPYLSLDPGQARIAYLQRDVWWHYPALVAHIAFGTVALTTVVLQMWTWLRVHHPRVHRISGRLYIFGGVLPSGLLALLITPFAGGPVGDAVEGVVWLGTTFYALKMVRRGDFARHRRWMMFSYALCAQVIWGRIIIITLTLTVPTWLTNNFALVLEAASWVGMMINVVIAQWWYEHTAKRPLAIRPA
ncbi:DUF2306 domain-containing protein [Streptosporangium carneum]|uniref:DUF2306 domain-containing protein n=1 Tax=Streptosporangium carneum TaxID=47481 RepID=A0A9W6I5M6_9ACTN|nr:DUF2306 domain-containing protein [Streptosporangium carneum]GLK11390.1 hypothetical protein GCM10017600_47970 [Streptosporangium carneum]